MAAMMFPAITPMVLLYNRLVGGGDNPTQKQKQADENLMVEEKPKYNNNSISLKLTLFVTCYLVVWALTGIILLLGWSIPMNSLLVWIMRFSGGSVVCIEVVDIEPYSSYSSYPIL